MSDYCKYALEVWTLQKLIDLILENGRLNLNPEYQRNAIWATPVQRQLIRTVSDGMPLPSFFIRKLKDNKFEMVDGQQRCRAIRAYYNDWLSDEHGKYFSDLTDEKRSLISKYSICVVMLDVRLTDDEVRDYYVLVNSSGVKLNKAELRKAEYHNTSLLALCSRLADNPLFKKLKMFTPKSIDRMSDIDFVSELVALLLFGITDKKITMEDAYNEDINETQSASLEKEFLRILEVVSILDDRAQISDTRLKQKADFYTLFGFLHNNPDFPIGNLHNMQDVMLALDDEISPSQEDCLPLREYALACVSQSNSIKAREHRQNFFSSMFLNKSDKPTTDQILVMSYLDVKSKELNGFLVVDVTK